MKEILAENARRMARLDVSYDPHLGLGGIGSRTYVAARGPIPEAWLPDTMLDDPRYHAATDLLSWQRLRCIHDFEYWAVTCVRIKDKMTGADIAFTLNRPQRRVASVLEEQRLAGRPIRLIMLKARQWGGSTNYHLLMYLNLFCNFAIWKYKS